MNKILWNLNNQGFVNFTLTIIMLSLQVFINVQKLIFGVTQINTQYEIDLKHKCLYLKTKSPNKCFGSI
jgi:hypothetical protein